MIIILIPPAYVLDQTIQSPGDTLTPTSGVCVLDPLLNPHPFQYLRRTQRSPADSNTREFRTLKVI